MMHQKTQQYCQQRQVERRMLVNVHTLYYSLNLIVIALVIMAICNISYNNIVLIKLIAETWRKNKGTQ